MQGFIAGLILIVYWVNSRFIAPLIAKKRLQEAQVKPTAISRKKYYTGTIVNYFVLVSIAVPTAVFNRIPIFGSIHIDLTLSLLALGLLTLCILLIDPLELKYTKADIRQSIGNYIPRTTTERIAWIAVSLVTAVSEEIAYRAVFYGIAYRLTGNFWEATIASAFLFTVAHWHFGVVGMPSTFFVGLGLQYFVKLSGGLYVSIAIHFFHNYVNGIIYGELCKRKCGGEVPEQARLSGDVVVPWSY
jgi:membrane protease YdiL (CAAX protease family)